jgi:hypothetical protein
LSARVLLNSGGGLASALLIASGVLVTGAYLLNGRTLDRRGIDVSQIGNHSESENSHAALPE